MSEQPGLLGSVKQLLSTLIGVLATRLELLSNELQEERLRLMRMFMLALFAALFAGLGLLLLVIFLIVLFWDDHRQAVVGGMSVLFFTASVWLAIALQRAFKQGSGLFATSLAELAKDKEVLVDEHE